MAENRSRFVLLCQQSLVLAVVAAVAAPAANMVTLDIVATPHQASAGSGGAAGASDAAAPVPRAADGSGTTSVVDTRPVAPRVSTVPLGGVSKAGLLALGQARAAQPTTGRPTATTTSGAARMVSASTTRRDRKAAVRAADLTVLSAPQPVDGLATVGVTWSSGTHVPDQAITVSVRTKRDGAWSTWTKVPYHQDEGPDPTSAEGRAAEPGTDPIYVGAVQDVQVKALTASGRVPTGMKLSLVNPGSSGATQAEKPAIDTGRLHPGTLGLAADETSTPSPAPSPAPATATTTDAASLATAAVTSKPTIYSRAQWGADERMRDRSSLHYGEVHGGFVHHTVNANSYSRAQVPSILRGIYAYHTQSRGWSDIGYNFLVDRFGRIWEGRYGGVDRPVVGAHTLGYNDDAFAMSAIGNYETTRPSARMLDAYGRLFAWKLSLHGVRASSTRQLITNRYLPAIDGHRDVGQTACPGRYLYARIPFIRSLAARYQRSWAGRDRQTNLAGTRRPDLVVRDKVTRRAYLIRSDGSGRAARVTRTGTSFRYANQVLNVGDWNGDGHGDVVTRSGQTGLVYLYRGNGAGSFAAPVRMSRTSFARIRLLAAVGDTTGDGHPDLMGQPSGGGLMRIYPGNGRTGFRHNYVAHASIPASAQLGVGLWNTDGAPDSVLRRSSGTLVLYAGNGPGGLTGGSVLGTVGRTYDWLLAVGDVSGDGRPDLIGRSRATGRLWLLPGTRTGLSHRRPYAGDMRRFDLAG
ncbi:MAG: FG-GAP-like repeat-containing protein [Nocardioidaceae bacterium]